MHSLYITEIYRLRDVFLLLIVWVCLYSLLHSKPQSIAVSKLVHYGRSRSSVLVPVERPYVTLCQSSIVGTAYAYLLSFLRYNDLFGENIHFFLPFLPIWSITLLLFFLFLLRHIYYFIAIQWRRNTSLTSLVIGLIFILGTCCCLPMFWLLYVFMLCSL